MAIFRNNVTSEEVREFWSLVEECKEKGFCESRQVTNYIIKNRLGDKYKHIAGDLYLRRSNITRDLRIAETKRKTVQGIMN